jgi:transcription elongation factor Elf1
VERDAVTLHRRVAAEKSERTLTCPRCLHKVSATISEEGGEATFTCPYCGYHGSVTAGESKEGQKNA